MAVGRYAGRIGLALLTAGTGVLTGGNLLEEPVLSATGVAASVGGLLALLVRLTREIDARSHGRRE